MKIRDYYLGYQAVSVIRVLARWGWVSPGPDQKYLPHQHLITSNKNCSQPLSRTLDCPTHTRLLCFREGSNSKVRQQATNAAGSGGQPDVEFVNDASHLQQIQQLEKMLFAKSDGWRGGWCLCGSH